MRPVETDDLTINFDTKRCIHARKCVLGLPQVFDPKAKPWIQPGDTDTDKLVAVIEACPSGALTYSRIDGPDESAPQVNTVRLWENGPLEVHGDLRIPGEDPQHRALICRCGMTSTPPYCNNAHKKGFTATGIVGRHDSDEMESRDGPVEITAFEDGPIQFSGKMEIVNGDGSTVAQKTDPVFCRCGASGNKPFCDGSHKALGFTKASGDG